MRKKKRIMIKKKIDSFFVHDETKDLIIEFLKIKWSKKIMIYLMNTQYMKNFLVRIIKMTIHLIGI